MAKEASVICDALEVESVHDTDMTKNGFKKILKESCLERDEKEMREKMASMSKCEAIRRDEFKIQDYMKSNSLGDIREIFRIKTRMNHLQGNFSRDPKYRGEAGMVCVGCGSIKETNSHVTECDVYADLLVGKDLSDDRDLVKFFRDVMKRRENIEEKKKMKKS